MTDEIKAPDMDGFDRANLSRRIRVAVVEDDRATSELLSKVITESTSLSLVKVFPDAESLLHEIDSLPVDVLVMDLKLPRSSGIECTRQVKDRRPEIQVVVFTMFSDSDLIMSALKAGSTGYLVKRSSASEIVEGIEEVWQGGAPMSPGIARKVVEALQAPAAGKLSEKQKLWNLTEREQEILNYLARGLSAKEIAHHLCVVEPTIRFHLRNVYQKLQVRSRSEAIVKFLK